MWALLLSDAPLIPDFVHSLDFAFNSFACRLIEEAPDDDGVAPPIMYGRDLLLLSRCSISCCLPINGDFRFDLATCRSKSPRSISIRFMGFAVVKVSARAEFAENIRDSPINETIDFAFETLISRLPIRVNVTCTSLGRINVPLNRIGRNLFACEALDW